MFSFKNHPFAVESRFRSSLVLTYAVPKADVERLIPECLTPDTWDDTWAFVAVAMVDTTNLRPKGFPEWMGNDFFLIGYRIFVRYTDTNQKRLRGLYILKSETDKKRMSFLGNRFTKYGYTTTDISFATTPERIRVNSLASDLEIEVGLTDETPVLPPGSPFRDWKEARRFAGPLPFTFSYTPKKREVLIIEGVRENWSPRPAEVLKHHVGFLSGLPFQNPVLASAFLLEDIPYYWKRGRTELWKG